MVDIFLSSLNFRPERKLRREILQSKLLKSVGFTSLPWLGFFLNHQQTSIDICKYCTCVRRALWLLCLVHKMHSWNTDINSGTLLDTQLIFKVTLYS